MYWGLVGVTFIAFSCATEFIPEINDKLRLVPFTTGFKTTLTTVMLIDYCGCWLVEQVFKRSFSDFRPKDIAIRRKDQLEREAARKKVEQEEADRKKEDEEREKREALEKKAIATVEARWSKNKKQ
jgi:manganese-transporting P-type ATPase